MKRLWKAIVMTLTISGIVKKVERFAKAGSSFTALVLSDKEDVKVIARGKFSDKMFDEVKVGTNILTSASDGACTIKDGVLRLFVDDYVVLASE